jgi:hypothetical protein
MRPACLDWDVPDERIEWLLFSGNPVPFHQCQTSTGWKNFLFPKKIVCFITKNPFFC